MEITLLLEDWQVRALEAAGRDQGLTAGQMMRCLVREFCREQTTAEPDRMDKLFREVKC